MKLKRIFFIYEEDVVIAVLICVPFISLFLIEMQLVSIYYVYIVVVLRVTTCTAIKYSFRGIIT